MMMKKLRKLRASHVLTFLVIALPRHQKINPFPNPLSPPISVASWTYQARLFLRPFVKIVRLWWPLRRRLVEAIVTTTVMTKVPAQDCHRQRPSHRNAIHCILKNDFWPSILEILVIAWFITKVKNNKWTIAPKQQWRMGLLFLVQEDECTQRKEKLWM